MLHSGWKSSSKGNLFCLLSDYHFSQWFQQGKDIEKKFLKIGRILWWWDAKSMRNWIWHHKKRAEILWWLQWFFLLWIKSDLQKLLLWTFALIAANYSYHHFYFCEYCQHIWSCQHIEKALESVTYHLINICAY